MIMPGSFLPKKTGKGRGRSHEEKETVNKENKTFRRSERDIESLVRMPKSTQRILTRTWEKGRRKRGITDWGREKG